MRIGRLRLPRSGMMLLKMITTMQVVIIKMPTMLERRTMMRLDPKDSSHSRVPRLDYQRVVWDPKLRKPSRRRADQNGINQWSLTRWPLRTELLTVWLMRCLETMPNLEVFTLTSQSRNYSWRRQRDSYLKGESIRDQLYKLSRKRNLRNLAKITVIYLIYTRIQLYEGINGWWIRSIYKLTTISYNLDTTIALSILFKI